MKKLRALLGSALLLVAGPCFAEDQWSGLRPQAEKEFAALSENGRAAYKRALIACSLYADDYDNANYRDQCKTAYKSFKVEFGGKIIGLIFENVIIFSGVTEANIELGDRNPNIYSNELAKASIATLQEIYRETNLHAATVTAAPIRPAIATGRDICRSRSDKQGDYSKFCR
jgi:hypothetical protein